MPGIIAHIGPKELKTGALLKLFEGDARAVCLDGDSRVNELWDRVVHQSAWARFWDNGVLTFVRNHHKHKTDYGDLLWFEPETYGYIARKIVTYPDPSTGEMRACPEALYNNDGSIARLPQETLRMAWELAMEVLEAASETKIDPSLYVVHVELLKYPGSYQELERVFDLIGSGSVWKRMGIKLDLARARARGFFARRFVRDLYAWSTLFPGLGRGMRALNGVFGRGHFYRLDPTYVPVGQAHVDGSRFLTLLASDRDMMKTEAYSPRLKTWEEMPMSPRSFVIFPGTFYDSRKIVQPTIHRYSICRTRPPESGRKLNLTFVLGISTREAFEARRPR